MYLIKRTSPCTAMVLLILGKYDHVSGIEKDRVKLENMASTGDRDILTSSFLLQ